LSKGFKLASLLAAGALVLSACGGGGDEAQPADTSEPTASSIKVGLAYDIGGRGDQSFNDAAAAGLDRAKADFGIEVTELEAGASETDADREERLRLLAGENEIVIAVGFAYSGAVATVAAEFPEVNFAIVDDAGAVGDNIANLVFAEEQGSFLVGAIAATATKSGTVGFIGGVNFPLIQKFEAGFIAGAKAANPSVKVLSQYLTEPPDFSGFTDPAKGRVTAEGMFDAGADVVYHAAGGSGGGLFEAAKAAGEGNWAIGVDSDQYQTADESVRDVILTSMLKRVDVAVYSAIEAVVNGSALSGSQVFDLAADGVGYSDSNPAVEEYAAVAEEWADKIRSGEVSVPTTP
jgi:basic membrane protein A and related proteins